MGSFPKGGTIPRSTWKIPWIGYYWDDFIDYEYLQVTILDTWLPPRKQNKLNFSITFPVLVPPPFMDGWLIISVTKLKKWPSCNWNISNVCIYLMIFPRNSQAASHPNVTHQSPRLFSKPPGESFCHVTAAASVKEPPTPSQGRVGALGVEPGS